MNSTPRIWYPIVVIILVSLVLGWFLFLIKIRLSGDSAAPHPLMSGAIIAVCGIVIIASIKKIVRRSKRQYPY